MPKSIPPLAGLTLGEARRAVAPLLAAAGIADAEREARLFVQLATKLTPERLLLDEARALTGEEARVLGEALQRRLAHEPLSRIRGERAFYGRTFKVTPAVLDPRPETETLVDIVLEWADATGGRQRPLSLIDIGTGSGCILLTLLAELPRARGLGTDVSVEALAVARANAVLAGVAGRARFMEARSLAGVTGTFDVLVSNPPYIPTKDIAGLDPGVRDFDPRPALDGGEDGLAVYREIAAGAGDLVPAGLMAVEVGAGQAEDVADIFTNAVENRAGEPVLRQDLGGHSRCVALLTHS
jgi:release factor glutamine methyltransferase